MGGLVHELKAAVGDRISKGGLLLSLEEGNGSQANRRTMSEASIPSAENAVEALKAGAYDYLTKPVDLKQFRSVVASALSWIVGLRLM